MATDSPALALQQAVFALLSADAGLAAQLGGARVYDHVPRATDAPYVHLGEMTMRDFSTASETSAEIRFSIIAWSREPGRAQALAVAQTVIALLHDQPLALDGHLLINLRHTATETTRGDATGGRRALARFRAVTEPISS